MFAPHAPPPMPSMGIGTGKASTERSLIGWEPFAAGHLEKTQQGRHWLVEAAPIETQTLSFLSDGIQRPLVST